MRVLLDENFPDPPGFDPSALDGDLEVVALRAFDAGLVERRVPDWFIYFRAHEAGFDALVTRDWHQSAQAEEMWAITRTDLSVLTWRKPGLDPVIEWGQLMAYLPEVRRLLAQEGPSIVFLPAPRLNAASHVEKAAGRQAQLANERAISREQFTREAALSTRTWLEDRGMADRFAPYYDRRERPI